MDFDAPKKKKKVDSVVVEWWVCAVSDREQWLCLELERVGESFSSGCVEWEKMLFPPLSPPHTLNFVLVRMCLPSILWTINLNLSVLKNLNLVRGHNYYGLLFSRRIALCSKWCASTVGSIQLIKTNASESDCGLRSNKNFSQLCLIWMLMSQK